MRSLRDIKKKSSRNLHTKMRVAAVYYANVTATPFLVYVRVHSEHTMHGDPSGTNLSSAEMHELKPAIIFDRLEVDKPPRKSFVVISDDEGYKVETIRPKDGEFIKAEVVSMTTAELVGKYTPASLP